MFRSLVMLGSATVFAAVNPLAALAAGQTEIPSVCHFESVSSEKFANANITGCFTAEVEHNGKLYVSTYISIMEVRTLMYASKDGDKIYILVKENGRWKIKWDVSTFDRDDQLRRIASDSFWLYFNRVPKF